MSALAWQARAACKPHGSLFDEPEGEMKADREARERNAKAICAACPARPDCLTFAVENYPQFGIWGGLNDEERYNLRRRQQRAAQTVARRAERAA